jgi:hypothetical protein
MAAKIESKYRVGRRALNNQGGKQAVFLSSLAK